MTLALATSNQVTLAATEGNGPDAPQVEAAVARNAPAKHDQERPITHSPLTLVVQPPEGSTVELIYVPDNGWTLDDRDASRKRAEGRVTPAVASQQKEDAVANRPLTVFIDGPTGYTYVWIRDEGWKFVGRITDHVK
jgi:hypothetical protein